MPSFLRPAMAATLSLAAVATLAQTLLGPPPAQRPDLRVPGLSLSRAVAHYGERVAATVVVENDGTRPLRGVRVRFFLGGRPIAKDRRLDLKAGERRALRVEFTAGLRGKQEFLVIVDPDNQVHERSEQNNTAGRTLGILSLPKALSHAGEPAGPAPAPVVPPPPKPRPVRKPRPNLVVEVETIEGRHYFQEGTVRVHLRNVSAQAPAPASEVGLRRVGSRGAWTATVPAPPLPPGAGVALGLPWPGGAPAGDYVAVADIRNQVDEGAGEADNRSKPFRPVPLGAQAATAPPRATAAARPPAPQPAPQGKGVQIPAPAAGAVVRSDGKLALRWQPAPGGDLDVLLVDVDTGQTVALARGLDGGRGRAEIDLPDQAALFGNYRVRLVRGGRLLGQGEAFEILPPGVFGRADQEDEEANVRVQADLAITETAFKAGRYHFTVVNRGPDAVPAHVAAAIRLRTYFVRRAPVRRRADYEICERRLYIGYAAGVKHELELGRDPDCSFGNLGEPFLFAVTRVEIPSIHDAVVLDGDYRNNARKLVYPGSP